MPLWTPEEIAKLWAGVVTGDEFFNVRVVKDDTKGEKGKPIQTE